MREEEFKNAIENILNERINSDIMFTPTGGKNSVIAHHVEWVKNHGNGKWDEKIAAQRFNEFKAGMESDLLK